MDSSIPWLVHLIRISIAYIRSMCTIPGTVAWIPFTFPASSDNNQSFPFKGISFWTALVKRLQYETKIPNNWAISINNWYLILLEKVCLLSCVIIKTKVNGIHNYVQWKSMVKKILLTNYCFKIQSVITNYYCSMDVQQINWASAER